MTDIKTPDDIKQLVVAFYTAVMQDIILAPVFIKLNFDLEAHLPIIISFWSGILLDIHSYKGNPVKVHQQINAITELSDEHFERWISIWSETINSLFTGVRADEAVFRANSIAGVMKSKLN
ncbi:MAG: group III truncated hemoglobin [Bacteroidota bacterium]